MQEDLRRREYRITWQESPLLPDESGGYQAPNRAHNLRVGFYPAGIHIVPRTTAHSADSEQAHLSSWQWEEEDKGGSWTFGLALTGFEHEGRATPVYTPTISVHENHVTYQRGSLTESYTNDQNGLEQEFQIPNLQPPITLELGLIGDLIPHLTDDDQAIQFTTTSGDPVLHYAPTRATDATGRHIPVHVELVRHHTPRTTFHVSRFTSHVLRLTLNDSTATHPITLRASITSLPSSANWIGESDQDDARLGYTLSTAGDVNGDGYSDLVVGVPWYDGGQTGEGAAFVYHGSATGLDSSPAWSAAGDQAGAHFGTGVFIAGDVNGDGYADVIIGAPDYDDAQTDQGAAFVYHGSLTGLTTGTADWSVTGDQASAHFGAAVSTAGDLNGDGYTDVIVGAPDYDSVQSDTGTAFVYHGSPTGLTTGSADWTTTGDQTAAHFGTAVSTAGDVNSDGYADVIIGAPRVDVSGTTTLTDTGQVYVYHGSPAGLTTGPADWTAWGDQAITRFGAAVSTAGDVNGDGYTDVIVGAPDHDVLGSITLTNAGQVCVYHGSSTGLTTGSADWMATGDQGGAHFGAAASVAGDVNSDGYADVIVGAPDYSSGQPGEGAAFVYHGSPDGLVANPAWSSHPTDQENANFGISVSTVGDVNGDGHSDLAIGASGYDHGQTDEGGAFVYHGSPAGLAAAPTWSAAGKQDRALVGWAVSTAGDVNGDGYADVIVGAPRYDHGQIEEGVAFLYAGGPDGPATNPAWMGESDQEWAWFGYAVATAGDVNNDGYSDVIVGAPRYDDVQLDVGAAYVYHGGPDGLIATPSWAGPPAGQNTTLFGVSPRFGTVVSTAGDVNGDGYADVIITANGYDAEGTNEGAAFAYHGGPTGLGDHPAWITHPTNQAYANFGRSASTAGDVNGDGYSDVIIGAPWYDNPLSDETDEVYDGTAFVYHGSSTGLTTGAADWMVTDVFTNAEFGIAVSTAGDVNKDGYSDVIVGAYKYTEILGVTPWREGAAFVYHGGSGGLASNPAWDAKGGQEQAKFGIAVSTAGDVNGDGYGDVVIGASSYADGQSHEGAALVYHGGPTGLTSGTADWIAEGNQERAAYGFAVSTAGDVNGDGYSDVIVGAPTYNETRSDGGAAFVYLGNGGGGMPVRAGQWRPPHGGEATPIAPLGRSNSANQVRLQLTGRSPLGREAVALQWQLAPIGTPFTAATVISGTSLPWSEVPASGVVLSRTVNGLTGDTLYRWRVRLLYQPGNRLGQTGSRWLHLPWNGPQEADFRTPYLLAPDRSTQVLPGQTAVYTHTLSNPIGETQTFTLTGGSSQGYTVTIAVATPSGGPTTTLAAFGHSPVTVTVQTSSTVISGTLDKTVVTATSSLSGHDTVHDITTIGLSLAADLSGVFLPLTLRYYPHP
ncbi:MAG: integrin alpha [Chloroflexota bacterium]|nr:integrin alpha [Chloroflexota bacterium]